jgi:hypothetical protein
MEQQSEWDRMSLTEKADMLSILALFPAMTIMVFLRRKLGFRFLTPLRFQVMALLLWGASGFSVFSGSILLGLPLALFALAMLVVAMFKRWSMWRLILYGESWHTYSRGVPWLCSILPLDEVKVKRFIEPPVAALIGFLISLLFPWLGYYLMFCAICLFIFESGDYQRALNQQLDMYDNLVDSEVMNQMMEHYQQAGEIAAKMPVEETAGIPTGTDPDLANAIGRRKARQGQAARKTAPSGKSAAGSDASKNTVTPPVGEVTGVQLGADSDLTTALGRRARKGGSPQVHMASSPQDTPSVSSPVQSAPLQQTTPLHATTQRIPQQQGIPVIASPHDPAFAALPSGAVCMTPDGEKRWKN